MIYQNGLSADDRHCALGIAKVIRNVISDYTPKLPDTIDKHRVVNAGLALALTATVEDQQGGHPMSEDSFVFPLFDALSIAISTASRSMTTVGGGKALRLDDLWSVINEHLVNIDGQGSPAVTRTSDGPNSGAFAIYDPKNQHQSAILRHEIAGAALMAAIAVRDVRVPVLAGTVGDPPIVSGLMAAGAIHASMLATLDKYQDEYDAIVTSSVLHGAVIAIETAATQAPGGRPTDRLNAAHKLLVGLLTDAQTVVADVLDRDREVANVN